MSVKNGRDYLYLIWKSEKNRKQYIVGELSKNSHFEFKYNNQVKEAEKEGFVPLIAFPDIDGEYCSKTLFPVFESRLPDKRRKDMANILKKYDMDTFEPYQLLKRSGARLPIDNLYFIDPIIDTQESFKRLFYIAGARHYIGCEGKNCDQSLNIGVGEELYLKQEPSNKDDSKAIMVYSCDDKKLGYIPRYYSSSVFDLMNDNRKLKVTVLSVDKNKCCDECIKVSLEVE